MRTPISLVALLLGLITGCGPANTDPKPINVTVDPRVQPTMPEKAKSEVKGNVIN